jgi:hypothetical protein
MSQRDRGIHLAVLIVLAAACASSGAAPASEHALPTAMDAARDSAFESLRRQVANGSIIADVQLGRTPPMAVGACIDPVAAARFELDRSLDLPPEHPPTIQGGALTLPRLPDALRASEVQTGIVVARWVVDTSGLAVPGSISIVSSPHGLMSVQVCGALLIARFTPAVDDGRIVRSRVEMPIRFAP